MMSEKMRAGIIMGASLVGAVFVAIVPDAKPLICGSVFAVGGALIP